MAEDVFAFDDGARLRAGTRLGLVATTPSGPLLAGRRAPKKESHPELYVPILSMPQRFMVAGLTACWLATFLAFWIWWLQPEHYVGWVGLLINSVLLFYMTYLPSYFLIVVNRLRQVDATLDVPDLRYAFVVTKAPSEPWPVAEKTLRAMLEQDFPRPYDVWLCDEDPNQETMDWCSANNVRLSTRRGVREYHQDHWPRRTKCKEGNLAYFYDTYGYVNYDIVAQLDCDHIPGPSYLAETARAFNDSSVGYVAAPSVCDTNAPFSWSARGRLYKEATFHGPSQAGHTLGMAPVCIGSHYAVRTRAVQTAGGIGPELAEDFSTSFLLNSAGWHGGFALNAQANGEGPHTFAAMVTQEFQWSRSLVVLLMETLPHHLRRLPWRLRFRFLFALSHYPLMALTISAGIALPVIAAVTGVPWVNVNYFEFLLRWMAVSVPLLALILLLRRWGLLRPRRVPIYSWENWLYSFTRWPYIAWGVVAAVIQKIRPRPVVFKVTPKARGGLESLSTQLMLPYASLSVLTSGAAFVGILTTNAYGYIFLCLLASLSYATVSSAVPLLHSRESARSAAATYGVALRATAVKPLVLAAVAWVLLVIAIVMYSHYIQQFLPL
jgi:cellulose synthase (UDP-forming)